MAFTLRSAVFEAGGKIPMTYTCDGKDISPMLSWDTPPQAVKTFALVCDDPDAPGGTWVHWVICNIPASAKGLPEGVPASRTLADGTIQGKNDFGRPGYGGPCPPRGKAHRYFFRLYALDKKLDVQPGLTRKELLKAMEGRILGQAELFGTYGR